MATLTRRRRTKPAMKSDPARGRPGVPPRLAFTIDRDLYVVDYEDGTDPADISNRQHAAAAAELLALMAKRDDDSLFHLDTEGTFFLLVPDEDDGWRAANTFTLTTLLYLTTT